MTKLETLDLERNALRRNELLFSWLSDDTQREELYAELRAADCPVLRFKSVLRSDNESGWPNQDVYLLSKKEHVETALTQYSVEPYRGLDSGGRFMLGLDNRVAHWKQNDAAVAALHFTDDEIKGCAREAFRRAAVLPLKDPGFKFDLAGLGTAAGIKGPPGLAVAAAVHFSLLLFGFRDESYLALAALSVGAYMRLVYQIIGRHFSEDSGLPAVDSAKADEIVQELKDEIRHSVERAREERPRTQEQERPIKWERSVIKRLLDHYRDLDSEELKVVIAGVIAGTVGNVCAAVSIALNEFFNRRDDSSGRTLIESARKAARRDPAMLKALILEALKRNPPAPFLARTSVGRMNFASKGGDMLIPDGAHVLLAMGAAQNDALVFGGPPGLPEFMHRCIGRHLAVPLVCEIVQQTLLLPGLARVINAQTDRPEKLEKLWGAICLRYPLQFQRDRRLNQQPLHVVLPIKEPIKENAEKLKTLTRLGASIVEDALDGRKHVHFAWFMLVENETHLAMLTVYDGNFDAYVEHFAVDVPLFDEQLKYLKDAPPTPTWKYPKEFVEWIRKYNRAPLGGYFYSAYPTRTVADVNNATKNMP